MEFSSMDELKERLTPALKIRVRELKRKNIKKGIVAQNKKKHWNCVRNRSKIIITFYLGGKVK